jgi:hypothetical protein
MAPTRRLWEMACTSHKAWRSCALPPSISLLDHCRATAPFPAQFSCISVYLNNVARLRLRFRCVRKNINKCIGTASSQFLYQIPGIFSLIALSS